jgi:CheY-like chemotaxis protein
MKKYSGHILIVEDDEHVVLTSRMILKQYFENIDSLNSPKTLETKLKQQTYHVILLDMNFSAGVTTGNEGLLELVKEAIHLFRYAFKPWISSESVLVYADRNLKMQVLINLVKNAVESIAALRKTNT